MKQRPPSARHDRIPKRTSTSSFRSILARVVVSVSFDLIFAFSDLTATCETKVHDKINRMDMNYNLSLSTEANHRNDDAHFLQPYARIRATMDYNYHSNYKPSRQSLQDSIITQMLNSTTILDADTGISCQSPSDNPWIVFTAGVMGAGKTHTIKKLEKQQVFPLKGFVVVDPDEIRRHFPEFEWYLHNGYGKVAGEMTRKEAGFISEILTKAALEARRNVLVDGSLRDHAWYKEYFKRLRLEFGELKIAILHITAPMSAVLDRVAKRGCQTGRVVPLETIQNAADQVPKSVIILRPLVDFFCELSNAPSSEKEIVTEGVSWNSFRQTWLQSCL